MSDVSLRIDSQASGDWSVEWQVGTQLAGEPISISAAEAQALTDFTRQLERQFGLLAELDSSAVAAVSEAVDYGLLQEFAAAERPTLYLPPGLLRPWLSALVPADETLLVLLEE